MANKLFGSASSIELSDTTHAGISTAIEALDGTLKLNFERTYFLTHFAAQCY